MANNFFQQEQQNKKNIRTVLTQEGVSALAEEMHDIVKTKNLSKIELLLKDIETIIDTFNNTNIDDAQIEKFLKININYLSHLFTQGYLLIHELREFYIGQKITYTYTYSKGKDLYKRENIPVEELLTTIGFTGWSRANSLTARMKVKPSFKGSSKIQGNALKIYKQLKYLNSKRGNQPLTKAGYIYEVFTLIMTDAKYQSWQNNPQLMYKNKPLVYELFAEARKNNVPFYKSGDLGRVQLKLWETAAPSLANLNTIAIVLRQYLQGLQTLLNLNNKEAEKIIMQLIFTTKSQSIVVNELLELGLNEAEDIVKQFINNSNLNIKWNMT